MLSRCAAVLGNTGSCCGKYDCAHLLLTAAQFFAHPFTRALELSAEYNSFALLIHCLLSCSLHRIIAGQETLVVGPVISAFPLGGFRAFSFEADPHRLWAGPFFFSPTLVWVTCCRNTPQKEATDTAVSPETAYKKNWSFVLSAPETFWTPPHSKQTPSMVMCCSGQSMPIEMQIVSGQRWRRTATPAVLSADKSQAEWTLMMMSRLYYPFSFIINNMLFCLSCCTEKQWPTSYLRWSNRTLIKTSHVLLREIKFYCVPWWQFRRL